MKDKLFFNTPDIYEFSNDKFEKIQIIPDGMLVFREMDLIKGKLNRYIVKKISQDKQKFLKTVVYTNSFHPQKYKKDAEYKNKVNYLLSDDNIRESMILGGYLGDITFDNKVIDDPQSLMVALTKKIIESEKQMGKDPKDIKISNVIKKMTGDEDGR